MVPGNIYYQPFFLNTSMKIYEILSAPVIEARMTLFPDLSPLTAADAKQAYNLAVKLLPPGVTPYQTGSTHAMMSGKSSVSSAGDMDIMIDIENLGKALGVQETDPKKHATAIKQAFDKWVKSAAAKQGIPDIETRLSGINLHTALPIGDKRFQVDFELVNDPENVHVFHRHEYRDNPYKGMHKQRLLASIARTTKSEEYPLGLAWSAFEGLKNRVEDPKKPGQTKTADLITNNADKVAKILLGSSASAKDLVNVPAILHALAKNNSQQDYETKIADARKEFESDTKFPPLPTYQDALKG